MPGQFTSPEGDLELIFVDDYALIDQYAATGSLWLWGRNFDGQLGDNTGGAGTNKSSPVQTISGGTNWKLVVNGKYHARAIKTDGTLWSWGRNLQGQLGDNTSGSSNKSSPVQTISGGANWKLIGAGGYHTAAIKTDGTLWLWGRNQYGQLGDNTPNAKSSPVQTISSGTNWKSITDSGINHTAAIKTDGTLWLWGRNQYGQLGDNSTVNKSSPVQTAAGGTNWKQVSSVGNYTAAIKTDGTLWSWGRNNYGQLIHNDITDKSSPVQELTGGTNWKLVACGSDSINMIKTDGTLWTCGRSNNGQLGDNTIVDKSSPVQTIAGGTNWKNVSAGAAFVAAIKTDGTLWLWGRNQYGQLGDNTRVDKSSPIQTVAGGTNWKQVSCGATFVSAIFFYDANNQYPNA